LLRKYSGLVFANDDESFETYAISQDEMHWKPFRRGGWCVIEEPNSYNGSNDKILPSFNPYGDYPFPR
jgi:hypothetical protein